MHIHSSWLQPVTSSYSTNETKCFCVQSKLVGGGLDHRVGDGPFVKEGFEAADALPDLADSWRTTGTAMERK